MTDQKTTLDRVIDALSWGHPKAHVAGDVTRGELLALLHELRARREEERAA